MNAHDRLIDLLLGLLDEREAEELQREVASSPELQAELRELREAFFALPEAGALEAPPAGSWQRLRAARAAAAAGAPATPGVVPAPARRPRWAQPWLAVAAALLLTVGASLAWGGLERRYAARLDHEQQVVAYWMLHPDIVILPLEAPADEDPSGLLCLLPEGRTLLLQVHPPEGRGRYLLWGSQGGERTLIGETDGRLLVFDRSGYERVEVEIAPRRGGDVTPVGSLALDGGNQHDYD